MIAIRPTNDGSLSGQLGMGSTLVHNGVASIRRTDRCSAYTSFSARYTDAHPILSALAMAVARRPRAFISRTREASIEGGGPELISALYRLDLPDWETSDDAMDKLQLATGNPVLVGYLSYIIGLLIAVAAVKATGTR